MHELQAIDGAAMQLTRNAAHFRRTVDFCMLGTDTGTRLQPGPAWQAYRGRWYPIGTSFGLFRVDGFFPGSPETAHTVSLFTWLATPKAWMTFKCPRPVKPVPFVADGSLCC